MKIQRRKKQPPASGMDAEWAAKPAPEQRQEHSAEQNRGLGTQQLVMQQPAPADRRRKEECNLGFRKGKRRPLMRNNPRQQNQDQQNDRADGFEQDQVLR